MSKRVWWARQLRPGNQEMHLSGENTNCYNFFLSSFYLFYFASFCPHYIYIFCIVLSSFYILQPAWMENFASTWIWGGESNCSWSVVYVCVIGKQLERISLSTFVFRWWPFCSRGPFLLLDLVQKVEGLPLCPQNPETLLTPPHLRAGPRADQ